MEPDLPGFKFPALLLIRGETRKQYSDMLELDVFTASGSSRVGESALMVVGTAWAKAHTRTYKAKSLVRHCSGAQRQYLMDLECQVMPGGGNS